MGADVVEVDTQAGYVNFGWVNPTKIDSEKIDELVHGAGYKTTSAQLGASGVIVKKQVAGKDVFFLKVHKTGQEFELKGVHDVGDNESIQLKFTKWPSLTVPFEVVK